MKIQSTHSTASAGRLSAFYGECELIFTAPTDADIYRCFSSLAQRCADHVTREQLWLEYGIPMSTSLTQPGIPQSLQRLFDAAPAIIARIEVEIGGVLIRFLRTSGHEPFRKSMFDTVELLAPGPLIIDEDELRDALQELAHCLNVVIARGTGLFARLAADISIASANLSRRAASSSRASR